MELVLGGADGVNGSAFVIGAAGIIVDFGASGEAGVIGAAGFIGAPVFFLVQHDVGWICLLGFQLCRAGHPGTQLGNDDSETIRVVMGTHN